MNSVTSDVRDDPPPPSVTPSGPGADCSGPASDTRAAVLSGTPATSVGEEVRRSSWASAHDNSLRRAAAFGDVEAFDEIVNRHGPAMLRYAQRTVADPGDAEEAVQDAFVSAWKALPDFRGESSLRTWLFTITRRKAMDVMRKRRPTPIADDMMSDLMVDDDHDGSDTGFVEALGAALLRLPESQRSAWLLREVEQMSYLEISGVMRTTETAVRGQLARARTNLQTQLGAWKR